MPLLLALTLLMVVGCATEAAKPSSLSAQSALSPCPPAPSGKMRDRSLAACAHDQNWWNEVGDALSGAATAVRLKP
ncbi:MAG: hypothetical protein U0412_06985 [Nitrospira sp.]